MQKNQVLKPTPIHRQMTAPPPTNECLEVEHSTADILADLENYADRLRASTEQMAAWIVGSDVGSDVGSENSHAPSGINSRLGRLVSVVTFTEGVVIKLSSYLGVQS